MPSAPSPPTSGRVRSTAGPATGRWSTTPPGRSSWSAPRTLGPAAGPDRTASTRRPAAATARPPPLRTPPAATARSARRSAVNRARPAQPADQQHLARPGRPPSPRAITQTSQRGPMQTHEIRRRFLDHFEKAGHTVVPSASLISQDADGAVHHRRHGAVQAVLPRPVDPAVPARHQRAEVRPDRRHRERRDHHPAQHVLPDGRQLLLRRLLQGRRDPARLGRC